MLTPYWSIKAVNGSKDGLIEFVERQYNSHTKIVECIIEFRVASIIFNVFTHSDHQYPN